MWPWQGQTISEIIDNAGIEDKRKFAEVISDALMLRNCSCDRIQQATAHSKSHVLPFLVLGAGFALLFNFACSEFKAFRSMTRSWKNSENSETNYRALSVHEFIKYR